MTLTLALTRLDAQLDGVFAARIGIAFLTNHYLAAKVVTLTLTLTLTLTITSPPRRRDSSHSHSEGTTVSIPW